MTCQECLTEIIKRQTEGVVYHSNMVDYYRFLGLDKMKEWHFDQMIKELEWSYQSKCKFDELFKMIPHFEMSDTTLIPQEWYDKTSLEINKGALKSLAKEGLTHWLGWEKATLDTYKQCASIFKENMNFGALCLVKDLIKEVQMEIYCIEDFMVDALSYDFSPEFLKG